MSGFLGPNPFDPIEGCRISDIDDALEDKYFGYLGKEGNWYIMRQNGGEYRYTRGLSNYQTGWTNRASLTYTYFDEVF